MTAPVNYLLSYRALDGRTEVVSVEGETSPAAAESVGREVSKLIQAGKALVIVDLSRVSFVDSALVRALQAAAESSASSRLIVVEPIDPKVAAPLEHSRVGPPVEVVPTLAAAARAAALPATELRGAIPPAPPPPPPEAARPRRALFGRRQTDQEILRELGQLRRAVKELSRDTQSDVEVPAAPSDDAVADALRAELAAARAEADRMEDEAEQAHARIQALESELAAARAEADRMEQEAEHAHGRIQALEGDLARAQTEAGTLRADLEAAQAGAAAAAGERDTVAELRAQLDAARDWRDTARAEIAAARTEADAARAEADRMEAEAEEAHARIHQLESELAMRDQAAPAPPAPDPEPPAAHPEPAVPAPEPAAPAPDPQPEPRPIAARDPSPEPEPAPPAPIAIDEPPRDDGPRPLVPVWADPRPINLSTAGIEELMLLPGIGRRPAERIIEFREEHGLDRVDDLYAIEEIPNDRITKIRPYVRV